MSKHFGLLLMILLITGTLNTEAIAQAESTFTYQGLLRRQGSPATGQYDFRFRLFTTLTGGTALDTIQRNGVGVINGLFTVELNFPNVQIGSNTLYLQTEVKLSNSTETYQQLSQRTAIRRVPYATYADRASWTGITGIPAGFADGIDNDTLYTAGAGLSLSSSNVFSILDNGIVSSMLANDVVTSEKIANNAVTTAKIADSVVTDPKIVSLSWSKLTGVPGSFPPSGTAGGDLGGTYPNPNVVRLQGHSVSNTTPGTGQVLKWNGSFWSPSDDLVGYNPWQIIGSSIFFNTGQVGIGTSVLSESLVEVNSNNLRVALRGTSSLTDGRGITGRASSLTGINEGVFGRTDSNQGRGVSGKAEQSTGTNVGVYGQADGNNGRGVHGRVGNPSGTPYGVLGEAPSGNGIAVHALGRMSGSGVKSFRIDHPLDPANRYLYHYVTESPDPMNSYSGVVELDSNGEAVIQLPKYFSEVSTAPRYSLTPVGAPMPNLHVSQKIHNNVFKIAGGVPGAEVSWRVEAVRNDNWVRAYGAPTEVDKIGYEKGRYQHPELFGQPIELGIFYVPESNEDDLVTLKFIPENKPNNQKQ